MKRELGVCCHLRDEKGTGPGVSRCRSRGGRKVRECAWGRKGGRQQSFGHTDFFFFFFRVFNPSVGFPVGTVVKNPPANAGDTVGFLGQEDPLEEGTATHSGILAWRIPWTEEPGGLQSLGSQRVRHD